MEQLFTALAIFGIGAGSFTLIFSLVWIFGGKKVRAQIKKEW